MPLRESTLQQARGGNTSKWSRIIGFVPFFRIVVLFLEQLRDQLLDAQRLGAGPVDDDLTHAEGWSAPHALGAKELEHGQFARHFWHPWYENEAWVHHLASYDPGTGRVVLAIRNSDFVDFQTRPHCHGYQTFPDGKVAPKKHHFALTIN